MSDTEGAPPKAAKRARAAYVQGPIAPIAHPMAGKKLHKKIYKVVKKAADAKALKRGVKEVVKAVRKGDGGLMVIAGDISPIDVISHLPVLCEDSALPYIFIQSKVRHAWGIRGLARFGVFTTGFRSLHLAGRAWLCSRHTATDLCRPSVDQSWAEGQGRL